MDQTVMSFAGTAARGSAIPSPVEGMMSYLEDTNDIQVYNGSAYTSTLGAVLLASVTASGSSVQIQNVFSSQYRNYKIFLNLSSTANARIVTELMSGSTLITNNYRINYEWGTTGRTIAGSGNTSDFVLQDTGFGANAFFSGEMNLFSPNLAAETAMTYFGMARGVAGSVARPDYQTSVGHHGLSTAYDGIAFTMGGTMSGTVQVYGMRS
jgi:hypothetical protein